MWPCRYFLCFLFVSVIGWIYETIYGVIVTGEWENRGFLYGPVCPIYGIGAVSIIALTEFLKEKGVFTEKPSLFLIFAIAFIGSFILEYATHYLLERLFCAYWWDYSDMPFNLNGRVCLPASLLFGFAGIAVIRYLAPLLAVLSGLLPIWLTELAALITMSIGSADAALTVSALTDFDKRVALLDSYIDRRMEQVVANLNGKKEDASQWLLEEKNRLYEETIENAVDHMNISYRHALARVKGFGKLPGKAMKLGKNGIRSGIYVFSLQWTKNITLKSVKRKLRLKKKKV